MEEYRKALYLNISDIIEPSSYSYNEETVTYQHINGGQVHSVYNEETRTYTPALSRSIGHIVYQYYLFNGEIKDCTHPFCVSIDTERNIVTNVTYYSSERIRSGLPIAFGMYNCYECFDTGNLKQILYEFPLCTKDELCSNNPEYYLVCDEMLTTSWQFKFTD